MSTHGPDGTVNFGAELHPENKAAQSGTLARSLQFMTRTFVKNEKSENDEKVMRAYYE